MGPFRQLVEKLRQQCESIIMVDSKLGETLDDSHTNHVDFPQGLLRLQWFYINCICDVVIV